MELKFFYCHFIWSEAESFNRTFMELKYYRKYAGYCGYEF